MYNVLTYRHKTLVPKELSNMGDIDFKLRVVNSFKKDRFSKYEMILFFKHIRSICMCLNRIVNNKKNINTKSAINSIVFLYKNYNDEFIDSVLAHHFHRIANSDEATITMQCIVKDAWDIVYK